MNPNHSLGEKEKKAQIHNFRPSSFFQRTSLPLKNSPTDNNSQNLDTLHQSNQLPLKLQEKKFYNIATSSEVIEAKGFSFG